MNPVPIVFLDAPRGTLLEELAAVRERPPAAPRADLEEDLALFKTTTDRAEAVEEITGFYRVYHSARYVGRALGASG